MKYKKIRWVIVGVYVFVICLFVSLGFILGMVYQQLLFTKEIGAVLSYTNIEVNFNATEFANELNKTFIPAWKEAFNKTIQGELLT